MIRRSPTKTSFDTRSKFPAPRQELPTRPHLPAPLVWSLRCASLQAWLKPVPFLLRGTARWRRGQMTADLLRAHPRSSAQLPSPGPRPRLSQMRLPILWRDQLQWAAARRRRRPSLSPLRPASQRSPPTPAKPSKGQMPTRICGNSQRPGWMKLCATHEGRGRHRHARSRPGDRALDGSPSIEARMVSAALSATANKTAFR